jgi:glycosyltransferase involved in cell wall biosynthesis
MNYAERVGTTQKIALSVLIPAFNEAGSVSTTIEAIRGSLMSAKISFEIIVIDDGSTDGTSEAASQTPARVICHGSNLGYGAALKSGREAASYDFIGIIDADGTYPPAAFIAMIDALQGADMAVGVRPVHIAGLPWARRPARWLLTKLTEYVTGTKIPDINSGMRVFPKALARQYLHLLPDGFSFTTTLTVASLCDRYRIAYEPIEYFERVGESKIIPRDFFDFISLVLRLSMLFRPLKLFVPIGMASLILGLIKLGADVAIAIGHPHSFVQNFFIIPMVSNSALILLLVGLQFLLAGMFAEAVLHNVSAPNTMKLRSRRCTVIEQAGPIAPPETAVGAITIAEPSE